ncbi:ABC transporter permease [Nocardioides marmorisolisilvae]|uniref:ABC transporter permease n=1 Tax=Nocardioides marmorisolisilvae TaxID=1542737 RepID=UPI001C831D95|nr:ABC transporter permease [Nocardioides marmorisolisilvae]
MVPLADPAFPDNCLTRNEWICGRYYSTRSHELESALLQHLGIVVASVALGLVLAIPLALLARRYRKLEGIIVGSTTAIYSIPSLALFSLLVPFTGLGRRTVLIGLGLYSLTVLVRAILDGLDAVPAEVREAATGIGYDGRRMLLRVEIPLALPAFMAGLRVATVSAVALTTVGSILDYGGLGDLILEDATFKAQVLAGSVLCVALAVTLDVILVISQRLLTPWARKPRRRAVAA